MFPFLRASGGRLTHTFLPRELTGRALSAAFVAALAMPAFACGVLAALSAPAKQPLETAMFTAYIPPAEEYCCTIALPDGRIGFGSLSIPDAASVFVIAPTPKVTRYMPQAQPPQASPEADIPIPTPDDF